MGDDDADGGRGQFGDGVATPLFEFRASRLKGGRAFSPNVIRIWPDRVEEYEHHVVRKKGTQTIAFAQVAQVATSRGLVWSDVTIESTGGHTISLIGLHKSVAERVKALLDENVQRVKSPLTPHQSSGPCRCFA